MVDVVTNHNGWNGSSDTVDYSRFHPFNDKKYYHDYCPISNYSDQVMVEECWLGDPRQTLIFPLSFVVTKADDLVHRTDLLWARVKITWE